MKFTKNCEVQSMSLSHAASLAFLYPCHDAVHQSELSTYQKHIVSSYVQMRVCAQNIVSGYCDLHQQTLLSRKVIADIGWFFNKDVRAVDGSNALWIPCLFLKLISSIPYIILRGRQLDVFWTQMN